MRAPASISSESECDSVAELGSENECDSVGELNSHAVFVRERDIQAMWRCAYIRLSNIVIWQRI